MSRKISNDVHLDGLIELRNEGSVLPKQKNINERNLKSSYFIAISEESKFFKTIGHSHCHRRRVDQVDWKEYECERNFGNSLEVFV